METKRYKNEDITAYLLGSLPESETEAFDELSFIDDDFNDRLNVVEKDLIDAYIQNELTGETLEKFENHYLTTPLRREKVEFAKTLQVYAKNKVTVKNEQNEQDKLGFFTFIGNLFSGQKMQLGFAVTAILLLIVGGFWIFTSRKQPDILTQKTPATTATPTKNINQNNQIETAIDENKNVSPPTTPTPKPTATVTLPPIPSPSISPTITQPIIASFVLTPPLRSGQTQTLPLSKQITTVSIQLQLEADDYTVYQVSLVNQAGKTLRQSGKLIAKNQGNNKVLNLNFPAQIFTNGFYSLSVTGIKADGASEIISDYPFRAVIK